VAEVQQKLDRTAAGFELRLEYYELSVEGLMAFRTEARADGGTSNIGRYDTF
jgi:hypothetical protein